MACKPAGRWPASSLRRSNVRANNTAPRELFEVVSHHGRIRTKHEEQIPHLLLPVIDLVCQVDEHRDGRDRRDGFRECPKPSIKHWSSPLRVLTAASVPLLRDHFLVLVTAHDRSEERRVG